MDSASEIVGAMQLAIQRAGLPERSPSQLRSLIGLGIRDVLMRLFPDRDPDRVHAQIASQRADRDDAAAHAALFPGVRDTLEQLRASGYELAVATGKSRRGLDQVLALTGTRDYFSHTRCADESAAKPAPDMIEDLLLRNATECEDALVIGDTEYDMRMAGAAGVKALGVTCGVHDAEHLRAAGAHDLIANVAALPNWLVKTQRVTAAN